jgi:hypothetical protein
MPLKARYRQILVVDAERFGSRPDPTQIWLRRRVYEIVRTAAEEAGIELGTDSQDRGDGAFWLLSGDVSKVDLSGRFIAHLHAGLLAYARLSNTESALRLRVALHAGDVTGDADGWVGTELNRACRLVDLPELRAALSAAPRAGLVLGVTDDWYRAVVRHGYPEVEPSAFGRVAFRAKEVDEQAWIRVPGYDRPPGIDRAASDEGPTAGGDPERRTAAPRPRPTTEADALPPPAFSSFSGATVHVTDGNLYGGHHYDGDGEGRDR